MRATAPATFWACRFFDYNVGVLGRRWFENGVTEDTDSLILHELGHEFCTNHADENYYRALTRLGARLKAAALGRAGMVPAASRSETMPDRIRAACDAACAVPNRFSSPLGLRSQGLFV